MSIKMIIGFLPWILFGLLAHHHAIMALLTALIASTVLFIVNIRRIKIIEIVGLVFFSILTLLLLVFRLKWLAPHIGLMVHTVLALTAWGSLLMGVPFTIQYAKETVDEKLWQTPLFIKINQYITGAWGVDFVLQAAMCELNSTSRWEYWGWISSALTIATLAFTLKFPAWYRKRAPGHDAQRDSEGESVPAE